MKKSLISILLIIIGLQSIAQPFGNAINLDGLNDFGVVDHHPSLNPGNGSWSVTFWLKAADKPQISPVVLKRFPGGGYTMYAYCFGSGDPHDADYGKKIRINHIEDAGITERSGVTSGDYIDGDWHHYVIIADKAQNGIVIYVDGQTVDFNYAYNLGSWPSVENGEPLYIGRGSSETFLEGELDELSIWNKAISPELIQKMQNDTLSPFYYNSVDSGLVAYYRFDEYENTGTGNGGSNDIMDLSVWQNHADIEGEPELVQSTILPIKNNDATLSNIQINSEELAGFNAATLNYQIELPAGTTIVPTVAVTPTDTNATVVITQAIELPGTATILVTAEDGTTQQIYTVDFSVAPNNDASLSSIEIDSEPLSGFETSMLDYFVELSSSITIIPTVSATTTDENASVIITQADNLRGTATILVTAEDGVTQQAYTIEFINVTGVLDFNRENILKVYPNPVSGKLHLEFPATIIPQQLKIIDINGRIILFQNSFTGNSIDVSEIPAGFFQLELNQNGKIYRAGFIKK